MLQGTTTWANIKQLISYMEPAAVAGYVETSSGSPTELAFYARMVNAEIAANPFKHSWRLREYTLTLTGATTYNLGTLIPDLDQVLQIVGDGLPNREAQYLSPSDFNFEIGGTWATIKGNTLEFKNPPSSGTLTIPYFTKWLVKTSGGVYQQDFTDGTDISIIPDTHSQILIEGIIEYIKRKAGKKEYTRTVQLFDGRVVNVTPFVYHHQQLILNDKDITSIVRDFRFRLI